MTLVWSLGAVAFSSHDRPFGILPYWRASGIYRPPTQSRTFSGSASAPTFIPGGCHVGRRIGGRIGVRTGERIRGRTKTRQAHPPESVAQPAYACLPTEPDSL
jgi:hypothetical protein